MTRIEWNHFFQTVYGPVFEGYHAYVDMALIRQDQYPALEKLAYLNDIELLVLAWLIILGDALSENNTWHSLGAIEEVFENYSGSAELVSEAAYNLLSEDLIQMAFPEVEGGIMRIRANVAALWSRGLLTTSCDSLLRSNAGKCSLLAKCLRN